MARTIVVTTDLSPASFSVLPSARSAAEAARLGIVVLHVIDPTVEETSVPSAAKAAIARRRQHARRLISQELRREHIDARLTIWIKEETQSTTDAIISVSCAEGALLIAMASRGMNTRIRAALLGSEAMRILTQSHIPVLMAGDGIASSEQQRDYSILFPTDGSSHAEAVARSLTAFLLDTRIACSIVELFDPEGRRGPIARALAARQFERWFPQDVTVRRPRSAPLLHSSMAEQVLNHARAGQCSAIALALQPSWFHRRLLRRGLGGTLLKESPVPIIFAR